MDETILQELRSGPALSASIPEGGEGSKIAREFRADSVGSADGRESSLPPPPPPVPSAATRTSFAQVTTMGGNYPVLLPTTPAPVQRTFLEPLPSESGPSSRWRAMGAAGASSPAAAAACDSLLGEQSQTPPTTPHSSSSGKGKGKGKSSSRKNEVSLLSNSISRSYR